MNEQRHLQLLRGGQEGDSRAKVIGDGMVALGLMILSAIVALFLLGLALALIWSALRWGWSVGS